jgi:exonuclease III
MKNSLLILLLFFCILSCNKDGKNDKQGTFTVLAYNVAGLPQGFNSDQFPELHTDSIGVLINESDIVQLQEDFCYHDKLLAHNKHKYVTVTKGCVPVGDGLNTFSNFFIQNLKRFKWNNCFGTDCLTPKGFSYSQIVINGDVIIDFYNIHCNAGSSAADLSARRGNLLQIVNYIIANSNDKPVIIMGDFNSRYTRNGDTLELLKNIGFKDAWVEVIRNGNYPVKGTPSLQNCTPNKTSELCEVVDKIFYRSTNTIQLSVTKYQLDDTRYYSKNNFPLSDHNPLFATFEFIRK